MKNTLSQYRHFLLVLLLLGISGCSVKTVYHQLDWVLAGFVEDYIHLTEEQDAEVEKRIASFMHWHKKTQLPVYSADLLQVKKNTEAGLTYEKIKDFYELLNQRWIALKNRIAPDIAAVLLTLDDKQKQKLFEKIRQQNDEYIEEYVNITQQERNEIIGERLIENFERWLGDLSDEQKAVFWQWVEKFKPIHEDRLEFRRAWQKELRLLLNSDLPEADRRKELIELFRHPEKFQSQVYTDKLAYNREQSAHLILATPPTEKQKQHLYSHIDYYVKNFNELAVEDAK